MPKEDKITATAIAGRRSSRGRALRLYLTCIIPDHLCVDGMGGENIPDEEIAAAVAMGANVIER